MLVEIRVSTDHLYSFFSPGLSVIQSLRFMLINKKPKKKKKDRSSFKIFTNYINQLSLDSSCPFSFRRAFSLGKFSVVKD